MNVYQRERAFDRRFYGVVTGTVVANVDPDNLGRIQVTFPWYDDGTVTEWCRVNQLYAGPGYGTFFIPEIHDEVLVAFVHGDMRMAIILGGLYSKVDPPPSARLADDVNNEKVIRTKAGHSIVFDDTTGKHAIRIASAAGNEIELDDASNQITVRTAGGQSVVMNGSDGSVTISASTIKLGSGAFSAVLGEALAAVYNTHTHSATGLPAPLIDATTLSSVVKVG